MTTFCMLQRMVYPERLELDSLIKVNTQPPTGSWCNESQLCDLQETRQQRRPTGTINERMSEQVAYNSPSGYIKQGNEMVGLLFL
jgi:hypothetical protein